MIAELVRMFADFVRAAFLPESLENLSDGEREKLGLWPTVSKSVVSGTWLPHCVRTIRLVLLLQYNTIQYNTIQYNTIQYNTIQCNTLAPELVSRQPNRMPQTFAPLLLLQKSNN